MFVVETVGDDIDASVAHCPRSSSTTSPSSERRSKCRRGRWGDRWFPPIPDGLRLAMIGPAGTGQVVFHVLERERIMPIVQVSFL